MKQELLSDALNRFVDYGRIRYAVSTVYTYQDLIKRFIKFVGDVPLSQVSLDDVSRYYLHLKQHSYADSSIAYMMISLRQFFKFLFLQKKMKWDYQLVGVPKYVQKSYPPVMAIEADKMISDIQVACFSDLRDKVIISFLFASGIRVSELVALTIADINLSLGYGSIISKKNQQKRMIFWDNRTHDMLKLYLEERRQHASSDALFISVSCSNYGKKLTTRSIQRLIRNYRPSPHITPHSFRHGLGMRAVQAGIHPRYVQKILGHRNLNSQQTYLDVHDEEVKDAYKKIKAG